MLTIIMVLQHIISINFPGKPLCLFRILLCDTHWGWVGLVELFSILKYQMLKSFFKRFRRWQEGPVLIQPRSAHTSAVTSQVIRGQVPQPTQVHVSHCQVIHGGHHHGRRLHQDYHDQHQSEQPQCHLFTFKGILLVGGGDSPGTTELVQ